MAQYPTAAASDANLYVAVNSKATVLAGALTSVGGNNGADIEVTDATGFPSAGFITIDQEAISYTSILSGPPRFAGIVRGADGTTATAHSASSTVKHNVIAAHHNAPKDEIIAVETDLVSTFASITPVTATNLATNLLNRLAMIVNQIKTMAGLTNWYDTARSYARLFKYQRPYLIWVSVTEIRIPNIFGTTVDILFPDGDYRSIDATTDVELRRMVITRNAVLSGSHQGGLRATESEANNTWYAVYAVKTTDSATKFVAVGTTLLPLATNEATLNSAFGTNGWVYLGMIRNGDNVSAGGDILSFQQAGAKTLFRNVVATAALGGGTGLRMANSASTATLTYTYSSGTGATDIPGQLSFADWFTTVQTGSSQSIEVRNPTINTVLSYFPGINGFWGVRVETVPADSIQIAIGAASACGITLAGFFDSALGVGSNPYL